jgi:hypothetical protein
MRVKEALSTPVSVRPPVRCQAIHVDSALLLWHTASECGTDVSMPATYNRYLQPLIAVQCTTQHGTIIADIVSTAHTLDSALPTFGVLRSQMQRPGKRAR